MGYYRRYFNYQKGNKVKQAGISWSNLIPPASKNREMYWFTYVCPCVRSYLIFFVTVLSATIAHIHLRMEWYVKYGSYTWLTEFSSASHLLPVSWLGSFLDASFCSCFVLQFPLQNKRLQPSTGSLVFCSC